MSYRSCMRSFGGNCSTCLNRCQNLVFLGIRVTERTGLTLRARAVPEMLRELVTAGQPFTIDHANVLDYA